MEKVIRVAAGQTMSDILGSLIRPLFENTGIPGYFSMATDIPPQFLDMEMPAKDYSLVLRDEKISRVDLMCRKAQFPSIQQVLWAVGWAGVDLMNVISEKPILFLHPPFRAHKCPWKGRDAWRQILVSRRGAGYCVETVCVVNTQEDKLLGYLQPTTFA